MKMALAGENAKTLEGESVVFDLENTRIDQILLEQFRKFLFDEVKLAVEKAC